MAYTRLCGQLNRFSFVNVLVSAHMCAWEREITESSESHAFLKMFVIVSSRSETKKKNEGEEEVGEEQKLRLIWYEKHVHAHAHRSISWWLLFRSFSVSFTPILHFPSSYTYHRYVHSVNAFIVFVFPFFSIHHAYIRSIVSTKRKWCKA